MTFGSIQLTKKLGKAMCHLRLLGLKDDQFTVSEFGLTTSLAFSDDFVLHIQLLGNIEDKPQASTTPDYVVNSSVEVNRLFDDLPQSLLVKGVIVVEVNGNNTTGFVMNEAGIVPLNNLTAELLHKAWHLLSLRKDKERNLLILARFAKSSKLAEQLTRNFKPQSRDTNE